MPDQTFLYVIRVQNVKIRPTDRKNLLLLILSCEIKVEYENESLRKITEEDYYNKKGVYNYVTNGKKLFSDMIDNNDFCVSANILFINRKWMLDEEIIFPEGVYFEDAVFCLK